MAILVTKHPQEKSPIHCEPRVLELTELVCKRISDNNGLLTPAEVEKVLLAGQRVYTAFSYYTFYTQVP